MVRYWGWTALLSAHLDHTVVRALRPSWTITWPSQLLGCVMISALTAPKCFIPRHLLPSFCLQ